MTNHQVNGVVEKTALSTVKKLYGVPNERGGTTWLDECPDYLQKPSEAPEFALVTRYAGKRSEDRNDNFKLYLSSLNVQSPYLKQLIRQVLGNYPGENLDAEDLGFDTPFHPFFHEWPTLNSAAQAAENEQKEEVDALINILTDEFENDLQDARNLTRNQNITFRLLWTLFPPGCPVLGDVNGKDHCFLVEGYKYLMQEQPPRFSVNILHLDFDGNRYGWQKTQSFITVFAGTTKISTLPVRPVHFCPEASEALEALTARGEMAASLLRQAPVYRYYDGRVKLHTAGDYDFEDVENFVEERVMVEPKVHSQLASRYCPRVFTVPHKLEFLLSRDAETKMARTRVASSQTSHLQNLNQHPVLRGGSVKLEEPPSRNDDESSLLHAHRWTSELVGIRPEAFCRSVVRGYLLGSKSWAEMEVDSISPIQWNDNAFEKLVIPPARKRLLEALVRQQKGQKKDLDDYVQGKGQGLIMLLAGPPGTGKTLTAESISDHLKLPLYAISASELGDSAQNIEKSFTQVLRLAASWEAVLLLDEADAFLEKRAPQDTPGVRERNKRVAAFLRILEYYRGILILTTNRAVNFDDAFYSRIHLTLTFKPLDQKSREDIWNNFVKGANIAPSDISRFASEVLNGRQIKNIVKMAKLLAEDSERVPLNAGHIRDVLSVAREDFGLQEEGTFPADIR